MPKVTIVLEDTPTGAVSVHSTYEPAIGQPCSPAQSAALEIFNRARRDWGLPSLQPVKLRPVLPASVTRAAIAADTRKAPLLAEVDIDAVHRTRDNVIAGGTDL